MKLYYIFYYIKDMQDAILSQEKLNKNLFKKDLANYNALFYVLVINPRNKMYSFLSNNQFSEYYSNSHFDFQQATSIDDIFTKFITYRLLETIQ